MFTGLIEAVGIVKGLKRTGDRKAVLTINRPGGLSGLKAGDSLAVNGVCLTLVSVDEQEISADVMTETLKKTTTGGLRPGSRVNLERPLSADGRFHGHMVTGHVSHTCPVYRISREQDTLSLSLMLPEELSGQVRSEGSIALNGVSLTVSRVSGRLIEIGIIPETQRRTNLGELARGSPVNVETDHLFFQAKQEEEKHDKRKNNRISLLYR